MSFIKEDRISTLDNFEEKENQKNEELNNEDVRFPKFNDNDVIIEDDKAIFHCFIIGGMNLGLQIIKQSSNYLISWVDFDSKKNVTIGVNQKNPLTIKNEKKNNELAKLLTDKVSNETAEELILSKLEEIGLYISNNNPFKHESYNEEDGEVTEMVKMSELRRNPEYNTLVVDEFMKKLSDEYDNDVLYFIGEKSKHLILNEGNNICKQLLIYETVILGRQGFFSEIHAHADSGKSFIFEISLMFIPDLYIFDVNDFTVASFLDEAIDDPFCYDRVLINLGDLGNEKRREKLEPIFDIIKILITEGKHVSRKKQKQNDGTLKTIGPELEAVLGALFSTVHEDSIDKTSQIESRTISSAPVNNINEEKLQFMQNSKLTGTIEHECYIETFKELEEFQDFLKYKVVQYEEKKEDLEIFVPFIKAFDNVSSNRSTGTRKVKQLLTLMETYAFLNYERSFKIKKTINGEEKEYLIPRKEDVQNFINISYDGAGLQVYEKNLLMKLKEEIELKNQEDIDEILTESSENFSWMENYDIAELQNEELLIKDLLNNYGLSKANRKYNKDLSADSDKDKKSFVFFTASEFRQIFKNHKAIKDVTEIPALINKLVDRGFINKLEAQTSINHNIYYLNESVEDVKEEYNLSEHDIHNAIDSLKTTLKKNPKDRNSEPLFDDNDLKDIIDNYEKFL